MKRQNLLKFRLHYSAISLCAVLLLGGTAWGQGTITFNAWAGLSSTYYEELGMWCNVVVPQGASYDNMVVAPAILGPSNIPYNSTPYLLWYRQYNPYNYVLLSLTNGSAFGLISVDLANPTAPSYSMLPITFLGFKAGGSTVTNTFTTPGGGANSFLNYQFGPEFASDLLSVQIDAPRWAMDNLVWVPEPSAFTLLGIGLLAIAWRGLCWRWKL